MVYKLKQLGISLDGDKPKNNLKKNKIYNLQVICSYFNGAEEVEIDESMLTDNQREAILLGLKELKDFATGSVYGDRIIEYRIVDFNLKDKYEDGCIVIDSTVDEFEDDIYTPVAPETEEDILEKGKKKASSKKKDKDEDDEDDDEVELDDLFD